MYFVKNEVGPYGSDFWQLVKPHFTNCVQISEYFQVGFG